MFVSHTKVLLHSSSVLSEQNDSCDLPPRFGYHPINLLHPSARTGMYMANDPHTGAIGTLWLAVGDLQGDLVTRFSWGKYMQSWWDHDGQLVVKPRGGRSWLFDSVANDPDASLAGHSTWTPRSPRNYWNCGRDSRVPHCEFGSGTDGPKRVDTSCIFVRFLMPLRSSLPQRSLQSLLLRRYQFDHLHLAIRQAVH